MYQINNALILPLATKTIIGKGGIAIIIIIVFIAITLSFSAEIIAYTSIIIFNIYQPYINPKADNKQLKLILHISFIFFTIFLALFAIVLNYSGISIR